MNDKLTPLGLWKSASNCWSWLNPPPHGFAQYSIVINNPISPPTHTKLAWYPQFFSLLKWHSYIKYFIYNYRPPTPLLYIYSLVPQKAQFYKTCCFKYFCNKEIIQLSLLLLLYFLFCPSGIRWSFHATDDWFSVKSSAQKLTSETKCGH